MSTTLTGNPASIVPADPVTVTAPSDGDVRNVASVNVATQEEIDYIAFLKRATYDGTRTVIALTVDSVGNVVTALPGLNAIGGVGITATNGTQTTAVGVAATGPLARSDTALTATTGSTTWDLCFANGSRSRQMAQASLQTTDATTTTIFTLAIPASKVVCVQTNLIGRKSDDSAGYVYQQVSAFRNPAGTAIAITGSPAALATLEDVATGGMAWVVSGSDMLLRVTGIAATTINWRATLDITYSG